MCRDKLHEMRKRRKDKNYVCIWKELNVFCFFFLLSFGEEGYENWHLTNTFFHSLDLTTWSCWGSRDIWWFLLYFKWPFGMKWLKTWCNFWIHESVEKVIEKLLGGHQKFFISKECRCEEKFKSHWSKIIKYIFYLQI